MASEQLASKKIHPFFTRPPKEIPCHPDSTEIAASTLSCSAQIRSHKNERNDDVIPEKQKTKRLRTGNSRVTVQYDLPSNSCDVGGQEQDQTPVDSGSRQDSHPLARARDSELNMEAISLLGDAKSEHDTSKPQRMVTLDLKSGTLGGPPRKPYTTAPDNDKPKRRGRPRIVKKLVVVIAYGSDSVSKFQIGKGINNILAGNAKPMQDMGKQGKVLKEVRSGSWNGKSLALRAGMTSVQNISCARPLSSATNAATAQSPKASHPFFLLKSKSSPPPSQEQKTSPDLISSKPPKLTAREFSTTPWQPKKPHPPPHPPPPLGRLPQFCGKTSENKFSGTKEPAWPWKDMVHVRGEHTGVRSSTYAKRESPHFALLPGRKSKSTATLVCPGQSVISQFEQQLSISKVVEKMQCLADDEFPHIPMQLRLPTRYFESGLQLRQRILPQLQTFSAPAEDSDDELASSPSQSETHAALSQLYNTLITSLPAFDRSDCENMLWAQKYAPPCACNVLQIGKEAILLKEWLEKLKIHTIDTGVAETENSKRRGRPSKDATVEKKKRKRSKLDDFIVESEDEEDEMDEVSGPEDNWTTADYGKLKTVIRNGDQAAKRKENAKLTNTVVISGPHGCGKTAAVYAVARELDYEVREIHAGSRRSGKDIAEMIEAMTQNHLVRQPMAGEDNDADTDDESSRDLKSGKQKTMASFFKPKTTPGISAKHEKKFSKRRQVKDEPKKASSQQKQSLILVEEVDILYEQDKQFWPTLVGLITQSKRPFIMTCNDENLVPLQNLNLHGIFRFSPPPPSLAVDHLLLVAANEGHALKRNAVESLYKERDHDLRASLNDLNFWCQMGVGDQRGGLGWYYPRWPKGADVDEHGHVVRVVSEDTYQKGMGYLCRDILCDFSNDTKLEINLMKQTWEGYELDVGQWQDTLDMQSWGDEVAEADKTRSLRLKSLEEYQQFSSSMSDADILSQGYFAQGSQVSVDATHPGLPPTLRDDCIIGRQLLDAVPTHTYDDLPISMAHWAKSMARNQLAIGSQPEIAARDSLISAMDESNAIYHIRMRHMPKIWDPVVTRMDMSRAFDPIAAFDKQLSLPLGSPDASVFDRTMSLITLEVAPYVRRIVSYETRLQEERLQSSSLLSERGGEGGRQQQGKKMRTRRSAYSALDGGLRRTTRRDKYFGNLLNPALVTKTGGADWNAALDMILAEVDVLPASAWHDRSGPTGPDTMDES